MKNLAFIDGQNLYQGIKLDRWSLNYKKFRIYLKDKYKVEKAYYFIGFFLDSEQKLYKNLEESGFILIFKNYVEEIKSNKKGNVDVDIVFNVMKNIVDNREFNQVLLVSGDGDYFNLVSYLINKNRFCKILFPNKKFASSLYKKIRTKHFDYINNLKMHIEYRGCK